MRRVEGSMKMILAIDVPGGGFPICADPAPGESRARITHRIRLHTISG
jgi:hypothetical protein